MVKVLVVDDDRTLAGLLRVRLKQEGYQVAVSYDGPSALQVARKLFPDLVVLDLILPRLSGLAVCRELRRDPRLEAAGILILSGQGEEADRILGFESGADDYVVKPCSLREIIVRVRALLRRQERQSIHLQRTEPLHCNGLALDPRMKRATRNGLPIPLTPLEFQILYLLASQPDRLFTRDELLESVWGTGRHVTPRSIDTYFWRLREKIESDPKNPVYLKTIRGCGYVFSAAETAPPNVVTLQKKKRLAAS